MTKNIFSKDQCLLIVVLLLLINSNKSFAQIDYTIGNGTTTNTTTSYPTPFGDYYEGSRAQYLYRASDLIAAGMLPGTITALKFPVSSVNAAGVHEGYKISVGTTSVTNLTSTSWEPVTNTVYGPTNYTPVTGTNTFTFSTPIIWDGTSNIIVEVCHGDVAALTSTIYTENASVPYTVVTYNASHSYRLDNIATGCGDPSTVESGTPTYRPNITFSVITVCNAPASIAVSNKTSTTATITWPAAPLVVNYGYVISTSATPPASTSSATVTTTPTVNLTGLIPNTKYYVHLYTKCTSTSTSPWATFDFTTDKPCLNPSNIDITNITTDSALIKWTTWPNASSYDLIIDTVATISSNSVINNILDNKYWAIPLKEMTKYYVFVRSKCISGEISIWAADSFVTPKRCGMPTVNISNINTNGAVLYWEDVSTAVTYEYSITSDMKAPKDGTRIGVTSLYAPALKDGVDYYFHLRCNCNDGGYLSSSEWTTVSFKTFPVGVKNIKGEEIAINLFPNPAQDVVTIQLSNANTANGSIEIINMDGKVLRTFEVNQSSTTIDIRELPAGLYFVKYITADISKQIKLIKS
jgi:hypothetical protein